MARSVFSVIASASIALALTASIVTSASAMSFSDYSASGASLGSRADVNELFSGRLAAVESRRARQAEALQDIRDNRNTVPAFATTRSKQGAQRPISLTLPF